VRIGIGLGSIEMKMSRTLAISVVVNEMAAVGLGATFYYLEFPQPVDEVSLRIYADPMAEGMLQAINTMNYTSFSMDFDSGLKEQINETYFASICSIIHSKVGDYTSKEFIRGERIVVQGCVRAYYNASFTDEPAGVTVMVAFSSDGGSTKVSEIGFDSPKLRAN
jgi:hypothetical protein